MCGISAILEFGSNDPLPALRKMHLAQKHRGPEGEGFLTISSDMKVQRSFDQMPAAHSLPRFSAAFRRLRIQDQSDNANQPFCSEDEKLWLLFNGEIYNFQELRGELETRGHRFRTRSDTEVVVEAYREWGMECVQKFEGMWAFLLVDLRSGRLLGSRDRLGIKPLFYAQEGERTYIASEPHAIARVIGQGAKMHAPLFRRFLQGQPPDAPTNTFFAGVQAFPAASWFEFSLCGQPMEPVIRKYWDLDDFRPDENDGRNFETLQAEFLHLLRDSVRLKANADTEVGALLSGGLDTSMVTMLLARMPRFQQKPLKTFSIAYSDPKMSEKTHIDMVAQEAGAQSICMELSPEKVFQSTDSVIAAQGHPLLGQDVIAQYLVYGLARSEGVTVVLEGQGADEMLAGMPFYESYLFADLLRRLQMVQLYREVGFRAKKYGRSRLAVVRSNIVAPMKVRISRSLGMPKYPWLERGERRSNDAVSNGYRDPSQLNRHLRRLVKTLNLPTVLGYQDRSSMAHSVESRVPFLDHRLVEFCFRLPLSAKLAQGDRKKILFEAARGIVPEPVRTRKDKKTFVSRPDWMPLRQYQAQLQDMCESSSFRQMPFVDAKRARTFVTDHLQSRHRDGYGVWRLYTAWRWMDLFQVS